MKSNHHGNGHSFFEAISQLFGKAQLPERKERSPGSSLPKMENAFNTALQQLNGKIEELKRQQQVQQVNGGKSTLSAHAEERERRIKQEHDQILADILAMHSKLETGIAQPTLEALEKFLKECSEKFDERLSLPEVMPCCHRGILRRFHREAAGAAWAELEERMALRSETWPATTQRDPIESDSVFKHRQQLKYLETMNTFVHYDISRSTELIRGIERAWQSNYPEQGTPLWRELVLEGVATALRARTLERYYNCLLENKEKVVGRAAELVGRELGALQTVLAEQTLTSLADAHRVASTSTRVLDEVIPEIAWQVIRTEVVENKN